MSKCSREREQMKYTFRKWTATKTQIGPSLRSFIFFLLGLLLFPAGCQQWLLGSSCQGILQIKKKTCTPWCLSSPWIVVCCHSYPSHNYVLSFRPVYIVAVAGFPLHKKKDKKGHEVFTNESRMGKWTRRCTLSERFGGTWTDNSLTIFPKRCLEIQTQVMKNI